jgi:hypothetical protein
VDDPLTIACCDWLVQVHKVKKYQFLFTLTTQEGISIKGESPVMTEFTLKGQSVQFQITILTVDGRPADIDGDIIVENSKPNCAQVDFDQETRIGRLTAQAEEGVGQVTFTADADLDEGTKHIIGVLDFATNYSQAAIMEITTGPIEEPTVEHRKPKSK